MKGKGAVFGVLLALVLVLGGAYALYGTLSQKVAHEDLAVEGQAAGSAPDQTKEDAGSSQEAARTAAPDFTVEDGNGNQVKLSDYLGKPIVLNFWASWCGPCQMEMPDFEEVYRERGEEIHFMMVNVTGGRETLESAQEFIAEKGYSFPVFYDTESEAANTYAAYSIPTTYFIDSEGYLAARAVGAIDRESLERGLAMIAD